MMLALKCTYCHQYLRAGLASCPRCCAVVRSDCEIEVDQKPVVLLRSEYDISMRDVMIENAGIQ